MHSVRRPNAIPMTMALVALLMSAVAFGATGQAEEAAKTSSDLPSASESIVDGGWTASGLLDEAVIGQNGETIGEVEDIMIDRKGRIVNVIIEGGGFLDIGDAHVAIPWQQVVRNLDGNLVVPLTAGDRDAIAEFANIDDMEPMDEFSRVRELIGSRLRASDGAVYGAVRDLILRDGEGAIAILVTPNREMSYGIGPVAVPFGDEAVALNEADIVVPHNIGRLQQLTPVNLDKLAE